MKNIFRTTALAAGALLVFASCDDVKLGERYEDMGEIKVERAVLLEDFTGQMCVNCPDAHKVIEDLEAQYGSDKVVAVSIHCGTFGLKVDDTDFSINQVFLTTEEGNTIMSSYPINSWPMGVINGGSPMTFDKWATAVRNAIEVPSNVSIDAKAEFIPNVPDEDETVYLDESGKWVVKNGCTGTISISAEVMSSVNRNAVVQMWIVENNIVAMQRYNGIMINDYVHNNVFRASVLGSGSGKDLKAGIATTVEGSIECRYTDKERWSVENLSVVVFVQDGSGVQQVQRVPLELASEAEDAE